MPSTSSSERARPLPVARTGVHRRGEPVHEAAAVGRGIRRRPGPRGGVPVRRPVVVMPDDGHPGPPALRQRPVRPAAFPFVADSPAAGVELALTLNAAEFLQDATGFGFGSYVHDEGILFSPRSSPMRCIASWRCRTYFACAARAMAMSVWLLNEDGPPIRSPSNAARWGEKTLREQ